MCKYCERRTDVKLGWDQPELPWHNNQDITRNISGNMIHTDDTVGVIHDYQTSSPVLILKDMWQMHYCLSCMDLLKTGGDMRLH